MTGAAASRAADQAATRPPLSKLVWVLAGALFVIHLLTNGAYAMFRDEFYYIACGKHLAWGYVDHPPLVALIARIAQALFGGSLRGLRLFPALAGSAVVLLAGAIARELGGDRRAQALAALGVIVAPVFLEDFTLFTMNAFEAVFWSLALWLVIRILRASAGPSSATRRFIATQWLILGVVAGVGLLDKHSVLFLLAGLLVGLVLTPARRQLLTPWPWLAGVLALAIFAPHLVWQARNGWPTLEFMNHARQFKNAIHSPLVFVAEQMLMMHPFTAPVWVAGVLWLLLATPARPFRPIGWAYVFILVVFIVTQAKNYYLAPFYPTLLAAGAVATTAFAARRRLAWLLPAIVALWLAGGAVLAPVVLPVMAPATLERYLAALHLHPTMSERHRAPRLTQTFADEFGWEEMVAKVARAWNGLTPAERAHCAIYANNYGEAGAIDYYGPRYGLPHAISGHNNYYLWGPSPPGATMVITIGETKEDVEKTFRSATVVDSTHNEWCMPYENDRPIIVGRDRINSLEEIWPRCKLYI